MSNNKSVWIQRGTIYSLTPNDFKTVDILPKGIYNLDINQDGHYYLNRIGDEFTFPSKLYDVESEFINRCVKTWNNTTKNLGILLNGYQGTGKTITGKLIANALNLPVIIIPHDMIGLADYLSTVPNECVIFIDEFEKMFREDQGRALLPLLDGIKSGTARKAFILTSNSTRIDDNYTSRPSRIRYIRDYNTISEKFIKAYCDDHLNDISYYDDILQYCMSCDNMTMDILVTLVEEVNIHGFDKDLLDEIFNAEPAEFVWRYSLITYVIPTPADYKELEEHIETQTMLKMFQMMEGKIPDKISEYSENYNNIETFVNRRIISSHDLYSYMPGEYIKSFNGNVQIVKPYNPETGLIIAYSMNDSELYYIKPYSSISIGELSNFSRVGL